MTIDQLQQLQADLKAIQELCKTETPEQVEVVWKEINELRESFKDYDDDEDSETIFITLDNMTWRRWYDDENNKPTCDFKVISLDCADLINTIQNME